MANNLTDFTRKQSLAKKKKHPVINLISISNTYFTLVIYCCPKFDFKQKLRLKNYPLYIYDF